MPETTFGTRFVAAVRAELHSTGPWSYDQIRRIEAADREVLASELHVTCAFLPAAFTQQVSTSDPETLGRLFSEEFRRHQERQARLMTLDVGEILDATPIEKGLILGVKHFLSVGVFFSFFVGRLVNEPVHLLFVRVLRRSPMRDYGDALLLTILTIAPIVGAAVLGNVLFRRSVARVLPVRAYLLSTVLYMALVLFFVAQEVSFFLRPLMSGQSLDQANPAMLRQTLLSLSLPALRLIALPGAYALVGWKMLGPRDA
jgi:hypothetical protein